MHRGHEKRTCFGGLTPDQDCAIVKLEHLFQNDTRYASYMSVPSGGGERGNSEHQTETAQGLCESQ